MIKKIKPVLLIISFHLILQGLHGQASSKMAGILENKFLNYCKSVPREEVYVHSDRSVYISGEDLWFKVFVTDRQSFRPSIRSRIVYFELLNRQNMPVIQRRILIKNGSGPGQIVLPDTLSTGAYTIRAYTNWMKNFLPENCFMKDISIFNTLSNNQFQNKKKSYVANQSLVHEKISARGINTRVKYSNDSVTVLINTSNEFRAENRNQVILFIQTRGNINHISTENISAQNIKVAIPKKRLMPGINQITVFNSDGKPVSEQYIFTQTQENRHFKLDYPDSVPRRARINMMLETGVIAESGLSVSVAPAKTCNGDISLANYMIFGSEFGPEMSGYNLDGLNEIDRDSILSDISSNWINWQLIMSHESPDYLYENETEDNFLHGRLLSDTEDSTKSRLILMCTPGKEASFQYTRTDSSGYFKFRLHIDESLKDLVIMPDMVLKNQKVIIEPSFSERYLSAGNRGDTSKEPIPGYVSKISINSQVQRIYGNDASLPSGNAVIEPEKPLRFYGKPDFELNLADYISLPAMSEVFHELVPDVSLKKRKSGEEISITYHIDERLYTTTPSLMIDGVIIKDATLISGLNPELVEKIDVLNGKYVVGKYIFPGLVNVITKTGDFNSVQLPDYMVRLHYRVIEGIRTFLSPQYLSAEMKDNTEPDYRNTLYWNPYIKADNTGKSEIEFWSSDNAGEYIINIQGFAQDGKIISLQKTIKVK